MPKTLKNDAAAKTARTSASAARYSLNEWFSAQGWKPSAFQLETWKRYLARESGLIVTPTGSGKTLAVFGGPLLEGLRERGRVSSPRKRGGSKTINPQPRLRVLWITPLRALATDTVRALRDPIDALGLEWTVAMRTGDASSRDKRLARSGKADVLVITPESLALLLSYPDTADHLKGLRCMIVDEWHELLGNKRGVLLQLCLARVRALGPAASTWGLSATIGNLAQARDALMAADGAQAAIVSSARPRSLTLQTLLPEEGERFPWAGHLGLSQLARVAEILRSARSNILFTNTRAQAELWHRALQSIWMEDAGTLALHHGSLDPKLRLSVEHGLRNGTLRCVVATSSLDLGVDFPAVDQVMQIGSPKGIARLLQRAGRAKHRPGEAGHIVCVPTHVLELIEYAAARKALEKERIESRPPLRLSLDVLAQHCVTLAVGGGFNADELYAEIRNTYAFAELESGQWKAVLDFIAQGGAALEHYPEYHRVSRSDDGVYRIEDRRIAFRQRLSIGTIGGDASVAVKFLKGGGLGSVEESFVGRLRAGDRFQFAGRTLELVQMRDMTAFVRIAKRKDGAVPRWQGGRMPMSSELSKEVEATLAEPQDAPEMRAIQPLLDLQERISALPRPGKLLAETLRTREGWHLFLYPFAGRSMHEGLAALLALRWGKLKPNTITFAVNDYGLALTAQAYAQMDEGILRSLFDGEGLIEDLRQSMNLGELARRQFRDIARIAGLLPPSLPGRAPRSLRQLQASSGLLFDVMQRFDPNHILLAQAQREVLETQLDIERLAEILSECRSSGIQLTQPNSLTPLSFPLWAEAMRGQLSTETWQDRVRRAAERLEKKYG